MSREDPSHSFAESKHLPVEILDYPSIAEHVMKYIKCKLAKIVKQLSMTWVVVPGTILISCFRVLLSFFHMPN